MYKTKSLQVLCEVTLVREKSLGMLCKDFYILETGISDISPEDRSGAFSAFRTKNKASDFYAAFS